MANSFSVNVKGVGAIQDKILKRLVALSVANQEAITNSAKHVAELASAAAPVSDDTTAPYAIHGELRDSLTYRTVGYERPGVFSAEAYTDIDYAWYVELGTWKMDAQPYMTPSMEYERTLLQASYAAILAVAMSRS